MVAENAAYVQAKQQSTKTKTSPTSSISKSIDLKPVLNVIKYAIENHEPTMTEFFRAALPATVD